MAAGYVPRSRLRPLRFRLSHSLFHAREPCRQDRERSRAPTSQPSSKRHALPSQTFASLFSLINRFSKCLFLDGDDPSSQYKTYGFDTLAFNNACALLSVAPHLLTYVLAQCGMKPFLQTIPSPQTEVVIHRFPWRKIVGKQVPRAPASQHTENGIDNLTVADFCEVPHEERP
jgi:hypothetical protein